MSVDLPVAAFVMEKTIDFSTICLNFGNKNTGTYGEYSRF
jgi:hypothetical protein